MKPPMLGSLVETQDRRGYVVFVGGPIPVLPDTRCPGWLSVVEAAEFHAAVLEKRMRFPGSLTSAAIVRYDASELSKIPARHMAVDIAAELKANIDYRISPRSRTAHARVKLWKRLRSMSTRIEMEEDGSFFVYGPQDSIMEDARLAFRLGLAGHMEFQP